MTTHTPGTWEAREIIAEHDDPPTLLGVSIFADGEAIAAMRGDGAQDFANAHLIAAAPELLAALTECADYLAEFMEEGRDHRVIKNADFAIAKARGQK